MLVRLNFPFRTGRRLLLQLTTSLTENVFGEKMCKGHLHVVIKSSWQAFISVIAKTTQIFFLFLDCYSLQRECIVGEMNCLCVICVCPHYSQVTTQTSGAFCLIFLYFLLLFTSKPVADWTTWNVTEIKKNDAMIRWTSGLSSTITIDHKDKGPFNKGH